MTLNQLYYFQTVAKLQHYRLAAQELNISQPSLSRSIATLEDELDIVLFQHVGRNIELTKYGIILLEHVEKILKEVDSATHHMKQLSDGFGRIDLAYVYPLSTSYIPHNVRQFLNEEKNHDIEFSFTQSYTKEMIKGLKNHIYDIIFASHAENEPDIEFFPIQINDLVIITPKGHPLSKEKEITLDCLTQYPVIGYDTNSGLGNILNSIFSEHKIHPNITCQCPDENSIASLVAEDFGIAIVSNIEQIQNANIEILPITSPHLTHTVYMAYLKENYQITVVKRFIKFIKKRTNTERNNP
ncbi:MAG: LysR family transcriptional regulator [Anaerostipes sp.]|jgi:DNA-binding transcriptional LysR family regulator|nr:LysR family transcriptional regulator [Anaerostipes sp.]MDD3745397.1 LysR family transcriptional regulator [Anaerostipes sp.]